EPGLCIRDQGCSVPCADNNERRRPEVPYPQHGPKLRIQWAEQRLTASTEARARYYAAEITCGLEHLHGMRIVYRDLKPENILIDDVWPRAHLRPGPGHRAGGGRGSQGKVGTLGYMAPEVVRGERYAFPVDWFGLGCIVFEMLAGRSPFRRRKERRETRRDRQVREDTEDYSAAGSDGESPSAEAFCRALLAKDPAERLGTASGANELRRARLFSGRYQLAPPRSRSRTRALLARSHAVYAKDVLDIEQFSTDFYSRFNTGAVSIPFQEEIIETECLRRSRAPAAAWWTLLNPDLPPFVAQERPVFEAVRRRQVGPQSRRFQRR
uniref:Protein kinase domain-containing protein n=1 Tax=Macrostomum lignano TaxID=282301 RepID=A0A1I8FJB7_9PLAT